MATIKLQSTKLANRLISYCEKRATGRDGVNCEPSLVREQFKATRELFGKPDGVQAHHVIQSFKPGEIDAREANEIGRMLAERMAPGFESVVYTHTDKAHIHNHIVINAVSFENGRKYHSDRTQLFAIREQSNELCREKNLETIRKPEARERFAMAEYKLVERGERLWKDELRTAIDKAREQTSSLRELQSHLKHHYGIEMKIQNKNVSYLHPEKQKYVRGAKLGQAYTKEVLEHEYGGQRESRVGAAEQQQQPRDEGRRGLDSILFQSFGGNSSASDHKRPENGDFERELQEGSREIRGSQPSSHESNQRIEEYSNQDRTGTARTHQTDGRDPAENRPISGQPEQPAEESRSGRRVLRAQDAERLRGRSEPGQTHVQGTPLPGGRDRNQQPDVQPSVHAATPAPVQKGILDVLAEAGRAIQREEAKQAHEQEIRRQQELKRLARYQTQDRGQEHER